MVGDVFRGAVEIRINLKVFLQERMLDVKINSTPDFVGILIF